MHVHEVRIRSRRGHGIVALRCGENSAQRRRTPESRFVGPESAHSQIPLARRLPAKTPHLDSHEPRQLAGQILHVDTRTTVDVRWILIGQEQRFHRPRLRRVTLF